MGSPSINLTKSPTATLSLLQASVDPSRTPCCTPIRRLVAQGFRAYTRQASPNLIPLQVSRPRPSLSRECRDCCCECPN